MDPKDLEFEETLADSELLLKNTENVPDGQRQAQFVCVITMVTPEGKVIQARGEVHGELLRAPAGTGGGAVGQVSSS